MANHMNRRTFLHAGAGTFLATLLSRYVQADGSAAPSVATAKSVILLWMNGGPSHIDTWDPKPGAPTGGPFKAIKTAHPALTVSEHMPRIAAVGDKLTVLRMSSKEGNHQRAQYLMHTGYAPNPTVEHPSMGAWMSKKLGAPTGGLPAFVSLGGPSFGAGFLGVQNGPFVVQAPGAMPDNLTSPVDAQRWARRQALLAGADERFALEVGGGMATDRRAVVGQAERLMGSADLQALDLASEPPALRAGYGDTPFGKGCLVARRLVERGVRFVEVVLDGWDTHQNNFERVKSQLGILDPAMGALVRDLEAKKLLSSTLIVWMGDFGRTPKINAQNGRDHWPGAWSAVLAGGGTKPGVLGATDAEGAKCVGRAYAVPDLMATVAKLAGLNPAEETISPIGRPIAVTDDGTPIAEAIA